MLRRHLRALLCSLLIASLCTPIVLAAPHDAVSPPTALRLLIDRLLQGFGFFSDDRTPASDAKGDDGEPVLSPDPDRGEDETLSDNASWAIDPDA